MSEIRTRLSGCPVESGKPPRGPAARRGSDRVARAIERHHPARTGDPEPGWEIPDFNSYHRVGPLSKRRPELVPPALAYVNFIIRSYQQIWRCTTSYSR